MSAGTKWILFVAVALMWIVPISEAQRKKDDPPPAPVPAQILSGKKAFISNLGAQISSRDLGGSITGRAFSVDPNRPYDLFYAALKNWGRYDLVNAPAEADLVFELSFIHPIVRDTVNQGNGGSIDDPQFTLSILDAKTHFVLWTLIVHLETAALAGNRNRNFDEGINDLVQQLKILVGQQAAIGPGR